MFSQTFLEQKIWCEFLQSLIWIVKYGNHRAHVGFVVFLNFRLLFVIKRKKFRRSERLFYVKFVQIRNRQTTSNIIKTQWQNNNRRIRVWLVFVSLGFRNRFEKKVTLVGCLHFRPCKVWRIVDCKPFSVSPGTAFRDIACISTLDFVTCRRVYTPGMCANICIRRARRWY